MDEHVNLIASPQSWIEGEALGQLNETARLPGMARAVGMPDLHPGKGHPIGAAFVHQVIPGSRCASPGMTICFSILWSSRL